MYIMCVEIFMIYKFDCLCEREWEISAIYETISGFGRGVDEYTLRGLAIDQ
jgi:hypothetical protein